MRRIRTQTLIGEYGHIDIEDEAIDREADTWAASYERAIETGELSQIPLKNGTTEPPTIWRFRHLSVSQKAWLGDHAQLGFATRETMLHAVQLALVGASNVVDDNGKPIAIEPERLPAMRDWKGVTTAKVDELMAGDLGLLMRLGVRIMSDDSPRNG